MDLAIQDENLRYDSKYLEYHVPPPIGGGPPVKFLVHPRDEGGVAILFIPNTPNTKTPPGFLQETMRLHWQTLGSHIVDFAFYSFDPYIRAPSSEVAQVAQMAGVRLGRRVAYLNFEQEYWRMSFTPPIGHTPLCWGMLSAAEEAKEMGYVECDGIKMLRDMEEKTRRYWQQRLRLSWNKIADNPAIKIRAISEGSTSEPVAFLPYLVGSLGTVHIKKVWLERSKRDWRHVRRVLYRSVHEQCAGKQLSVHCEAEDGELLSFLDSWGYKKESRFWNGMYY